jgi:hypothetical protein
MDLENALCARAETIRRVGRPRPLIRRPWNIPRLPAPCAREPNLARNASARQCEDALTLT